MFIGNAGSDYGGIGHSRAFDAGTGKRLWNFDTVASADDAAKTWPDDPRQAKAGGGTYSSYALDPKDQRFGHVTAVDADSGKVLWRYDTDTSMVASLTPTAGGVLLTGDTKGNFLAFDAANGQVLLKKDLGDAIGGGISTYMLGDIQYVAIAGGMKNPIVDTESGPAWVAIFALPAK